MSNIYLVGMMGSGKTVTGKKLAELLSYSFLDLDERIQQKSGRTVSEIFEKDGESSFRDQERKVLEETISTDKQVVATGGGAVLRSENISLMRRAGKVVFLDTSLNVIWDRVKNKKDRPLLKGDNPFEKLKKIFYDRESIYQDAADFIVNTDGLSADTAAKKVFERLRNRENHSG